MAPNLCSNCAMRVYEYGLTLRPVSFCTVPKGFISFGKNARFPHGTVNYSKPLLRLQIEQFDLEPLDPRDPINVRKRTAAVAEKIERLFLRDNAVRATFPSGHSILLTECLSGANPLRVTRFLPDGTPTGHEEYSDFYSDNFLNGAVSAFLDKDLTIEG